MGYWERYFMRSIAAVYTHPEKTNMNTIGSFTGVMLHKVDFIKIITYL